MPKSFIDLVLGCLFSMMVVVAPCAFGGFELLPVWVALIFCLLLFRWFLIWLWDYRLGAVAGLLCPALFVAWVLNRRLHAVIEKLRVIDDLRAGVAQDDRFKVAPDAMEGRGVGQDRPDAW